MRLTTDTALTGGTGESIAPDARPDADLVGAVLLGDRRAFAALVGRYERAVLATAWGVLRDRHLAQDAAQDAFVSAYTNLRRLRDPASFAPWLLSIARRVATRSSKRRRPTGPLPDEHPPEHEVADAANLDWALAATEDLPEHERVVVYLRYFQDLDVGEIARVVARPVGTVTKQLSRAHERLRERLRKEGLP